MEKRIAGIVRWLERCLSACRAGVMENALMDVECARAEIERLRDEVWRKTECLYAEKAQKRRNLAFFDKLLRVSFGAMVFVLAIATPLAFVAQNEERNERVVSLELEWVTPDEKTLLSNLRKHLSDNNAFASIQAETLVYESRSEGFKELDEKKELTKKAIPSKPTKALEMDEKMMKETRIPYDRILSLVQTGEKALKNEQPAIRIVGE